MRNHLISLSIFVAAAGAIFYWATTSTAQDEQAVTVALIEYFKTDSDDMDWSDVAFYSYPTSCLDGFEPSFSKDEGIYVKHLKVNRESEPIELVALHGKINLVSWEDNRRIWDTKLLSFKFQGSSKNLIKLSRVAFSKNRKKAIICVEGQLSGEFILFEKEDGKWLYSGSRPTWVT